MPQQSSHSLDLIAEHVAEWVEKTAQELADALRENGHAPGAAPLNEKQKVAHYEQMLYHPDGSENSLGHEQLMKTVGSDAMGLRQYAQIKAAILKARQDRVKLQPFPMVDAENE